MATRKQATVQEQATYLLNARKVSRGRPKKWENFTAQEKRLAIAYDMIQAVLASVYEPKTHNGYIKRGVLEDVAEAAGITSIRELLNTPGLVQDCEVCILGGCFLSLIRFENHVSISELDEQYFGFRDSSARQRLAESFDPFQLDLLESAFETDMAHSIVEDDHDYSIAEKRKLAAAVHFGKAYADPSDRALAVLINVVKNKGTFKP